MESMRVSDGQVWGAVTHCELHTDGNKYVAKGPEGKVDK